MSRWTMPSRCRAESAARHSRRTAIATPGFSLGWTAPAVTNGSAVTGYTITAFHGFSPVGTMTFNSTATTQTYTGLTAGTTYAFKVAAINARGTGVTSTLSNTVTPT